MSERRRYLSARAAFSKDESAKKAAHRIRRTRTTTQRTWVVLRSLCVVVHVLRVLRLLRLQQVTGCRQRASDRRVQQVTSTPRGQAGPIWSPDGRMIAFPMSRRLLGSRCASLGATLPEPGVLRRRLANVRTVPRTGRRTLVVSPS